MNRWLYGMGNYLLIRYGALFLLLLMFMELLFFIFAFHYYLSPYQIGLEKELGRVTDSLSASDKQALFLSDSPKIDKLHQKSAWPVQLLGPDGVEIARQADFVLGKDTRHLPVDIQQALRGEVGTMRAMVDEPILYLTKPVYQSQNLIGIVRMQRSLLPLYHKLKPLIKITIIVGLCALLFFTIGNFHIAKNYTTPIEELKQATKAMADGVNIDEINIPEGHEIRILADNIVRLANEIQAADQIKQDFISSISHELRTPLTSIKGWSETLQLEESIQQSKDASLGLGIISSESDRLVNMVEELLDYSRIESRKQPLNMQVLSIKQLLEDVYIQFLPRAGDSEFSMETYGKDQMIYADPNRLRQVYINLISNAFKFTPEGGKITIIYEGFEKEVLTQVVDSGIGISKEEIENVKKKFYKESLSTPGSGLGLSIAEEIVHLHKGKMTIKSKKDIGTEINVYFPVYQERRGLLINTNNQ